MYDTAFKAYSNLNLSNKPIPKTKEMSKGLLSRNKNTSFTDAELSPAQRVKQYAQKIREKREALKDNG